MQNAHLKSGKISDFVPIGQDGQPVYRNADAFISALNLHPKVGPKFTCHLAKPKIAADGDTIDWYIPFNPKNPDGQYRIVTWQAATPEEQAAARTQLRQLELILKQVGTELSKHQKAGASTLFAHYLTGQSSVQQLPAIHFPNNDYVFIVDGVPVITFWGFTENGAPMTQSPFASLKGGATVPPLGAGAAAVGAGMAGTAQAAPQNQPQQEDRSRNKGCLFSLRWLLLLPLLLLLLGLLWWLLPWLLGLFNLSLPSLGIGGGGGDIGLDAPALEEEATVDPSTDTINFDPQGPTVNLDGTGPNLQFDGSGPNLQVEGAGNNLQVELGGADGTMELASYPGEVPPAEALPNGELPPDSGMMPPDNGMVPPELAPDAGVPVEEAAPEVQPEGMPPEGMIPPESMVPPEGMVPPDPNLMLPAGMLPPEGMQLPEGMTEQELAIEAARRAEEAATGTPGTSMVPPELALNEQSLSFSSQDLAQQGASVLNGSWNTRSGLMDRATGTPLQLGYDFKGEQGQVTVTRPDGVKCTAKTSAAVAGSELNIATAGRAQCPDGQSYQLPEVKCAAQNNGQVRCSGHYGSYNFPIQFYAQ